MSNKRIYPILLTHPGETPGDWARTASNTIVQYMEDHVPFIGMHMVTAPSIILYGGVYSGEIYDDELTITDNRQLDNSHITKFEIGKKDANDPKEYIKNSYRTSN